MRGVFPPGWASRKASIAGLSIWRGRQAGSRCDRGFKRLAGPGDRVDALPQLPPFSIEQKEPVSLAQGNVPQVSPVLHGDEGIDPGVRWEGKRVASPGKAPHPVPVSIDPEYGALENRCRVGFLW